MPRSALTGSRPMPPARRRCSRRWREPDGDGLALMREAADAMRLSARGFHRVLKVARTLADLDGEERVRRMHLAEALSYRARTPTAARPPSPERPTAAGRSRL